MFFACQAAVTTATGATATVITTLKAITRRLTTPALIADLTVFAALIPASSEITCTLACRTTRGIINTGPATASTTVTTAVFPFTIRRATTTVRQAYLRTLAPAIPGTGIAILT